MDKQTAYKILNLENTASFSDAKKAYRRLAKQFHPDIVETKTGISDDKKMKEINLAFFYLTPILRAEKKREVRAQDVKKSPKVKKTSKTAKTYESAKTEKNRKKETVNQGVSFFSNLFETVFARGKPKRNYKKKVNKYRAKQKTETVRAKRKSFIQVFNRVGGREFVLKENQRIKANKRKKAHTSRKQGVTHKKTYQGYQAYMKFKKNMLAVKRRRNANAGITRVEKIDPVRPVSPVNSDKS